MSKQNFIAVNRTYDLYELIRGEVDTVKAYVVDKDTVGKKTSIFPTVSFTLPVPDQKKMGLFQYVITEADEEGNQQDVSCSLALTESLSDEAIDALDLVYLTDEEGELYFEMDRDFFTVTLPNLNVANVYDKLAVPYLKETTREQSAVFTVPAQSEESGETMVLYSTVELDKEQFDKLNATETYKSGSLMLNLNAVVLSFNVDQAIINLCESLSSEHAIDPVSVTVTKQVVTEACYKLANEYHEMLAIPEPEQEAPAKEEVVAEETEEGLVGDETGAELV